LTLIAAIMSRDALIMSADTEEVIPDALRTRGEKIHIISPTSAEWKLVVAGAGDVDYICMARDLIEEKVSCSEGTNQEITDAIRDATSQIWQNHARYEQHAVNLRLLVGSLSADNVLRLIVVSGVAVHDGRDLEAMGIGDATFRALADRFLPHGRLSHVSAQNEAIRSFVIYAMLQAKQTIPGVGGNTRVLTLTRNGEIKWEKSWKVAALQEFFSRFDSTIRDCMHGLMPDADLDPEKFLEALHKHLRNDMKRLQRELKKIEENKSWF